MLLPGDILLLRGNGKSPVSSIAAVLSLGDGGSESSLSSMNALIRSLLLLAAFTLTLSRPAGAAQTGTAFTYQGRLNDNGATAAGIYDFTVQLHSAATGGSALAEASLPGVPVTGGVFTVQLDFGAAVFDGSARWLEIGVRKLGEGDAWTALSPRHEIAPAPYALLAKKVPDGSITSASLAPGAVGASQLAGGSVTPDKLSPGAAATNLAASGQSGVASGGVVLSASAVAPDLLAAGYFQVGKADMVPERWYGYPDSLDSPTPVSAFAKAVWSGTELLVWGGSTNAGARYNPVTQVWTAMSQVNAPEGRDGHCVVWTGTEMLVWGGFGATSGLTNTGGRYNPVTNTWQSISTVNAPAPRMNIPAVWTGTELIVWGGTDAGEESNTGGRYNPATNTWQATSTVNAPAARFGHVLVWTGSRMIVCGGGRAAVYEGLDYEEALTSVRSYNPATNSWTTLADGPAAIHGAAVWTGANVILSGGYDYLTYINDNNPYSPYPVVRREESAAATAYTVATNTWGQPITPSLLSRHRHTAVWTGSEMIVWGGLSQGSPWALDDGVRYQPASGTWTPLPLTNVPSGRRGHSMVWTGSLMLIWGGGQSDGGRFDPAANAWSPMTGLTERSARTGASSVWTGKEFIVWGGIDDYGAIIQYGQRWFLNGSWGSITSQGAPTARYGHSVVWTGSRMIIWGGRNPAGALNDGAAYDPETNTWSPLPSLGAPTARSGHRAVWTGTEMIIWGGAGATDTPLQSGKRYRPATNSWHQMSASGAPGGRHRFAFLWTGNEVVLWGGDFRNSEPVSGGRYYPDTDSWLPVSLTNVPPGRTLPGAVWTGKEAVFWGGGDAANGYPSVHGRYHPATDTWSQVSSTGAPGARSGHATVWNGSRMIVWGGENGGALFSTGAWYVPETDKWTAITQGLTGTPGALKEPYAAWAGNVMLIWGGRDATGLLRQPFTYTPPTSFYLYQRP